MALEHQDLSKLLETGIVAARLAGQRAMEEIGYVKSSVKGDRELVTPTDSRCQQIIIDRIKENFPDHGFMGEEGAEGKMLKSPPRGNEKIWWVIDPIDGTNNFAHQMPVFCVCIAAFYENEPVVGILFDPVAERMYTACKDGEAQLNGRKISAGEETINRFAGIGLDSHVEPPLPQWMKDVMFRTRFRNFGSVGLQLAYVACGCLIATISSTIKLWDIAAGALIAEYAGAVVTDHQGKKLFPLNVAEYDGSEIHILAANKKVHGELLDMLKA